MSTNQELLDRYGLTAELEAAALEEFVPLVCGFQRQGDVMIVPAPKLAPATTPIPAAGVVVVRSEARQGNTHMLHVYSGDAFFDPDPRPEKGSMVVYGTLTVDVEADLIHTGEHGIRRIGPGTYQIRGQVEGATEIRRVAD